jgi:hypothetical protein
VANFGVTGPYFSEEEEEEEVEDQHAFAVTSARHVEILWTASHYN